MQNQSCFSVIASLGAKWRQRCQPRLLRRFSVFFLALTGLLSAVIPASAATAATPTPEWPLGSSDVRGAAFESGGNTGNVLWHSDGRSIILEFFVVNDATHIITYSVRATGVPEAPGVMSWTSVDSLGNVTTGTSTYNVEVGCPCNAVAGGAAIIGVGVCSLGGPIACILYGGGVATVNNQCNDTCDNDPAPSVQPPICSGMSMMIRDEIGAGNQPGFTDAFGEDLVSCNENVDAMSLHQFLVDDGLSQTFGPGDSSCGAGVNCANFERWIFLLPGHCYHIYDQWVVDYHAPGSPDEQNVSGTSNSSQLCV